MTNSDDERKQKNPLSAKAADKLEQAEKTCDCHMFSVKKIVGQERH